jgi:hypothetical protein
MLFYADDVILLGDNIDTINKKDKNFIWRPLGGCSRSKHREN